MLFNILMLYFDLKSDLINRLSFIKRRASLQIDACKSLFVPSRLPSRVYKLGSSRFVKLYITEVAVLLFLLFSNNSNSLS